MPVMQRFFKYSALLVLTGAWSCQESSNRSSGSKGPDTAAAPQRAFNLADAGSITDMQTMITQAYASGSGTMTIAPGTYYLQAPGPGAPHITLNNFSNFSILASGVTFVYTSMANDGLVLNQSSHVQIDGLTVDYLNPAFSQGQVIAVDANQKYIDVQVDAGYPTNLDDTAFFAATPVVYIYDSQTNLIKVGSGDLYATSISRLSPNTFRYQLPYGTTNAAPGDLFSTRANFTEATRLAASDHITFSNYTVLGGGYGLLETDSQGYNVYKNFKVTYGAMPNGATRQRLVSTNADAFHSDKVRNGPVVQNCLFEGMTDDGLNIQGRYAEVTAVSGNTLTIALTWANFFAIGDRLRLYGQNGVLKGTANVTAVAAAPAGYQPSSALVGGFSGSNYAQLTLDATLAAGFGDMVMDPDANGKNFQVINTTVRNNRARGMLVKADGGTISGSTFDGSSMYGLLVDPEGSWGEAGYTQNLSIKNNTFTHLGRSNGGYYQAVHVGGPNTALGHQSLTMEANTFVDNYGVDLSLSNIQGGALYSNSFKGKPTLGITATSSVAIANSDSITFSKNQFPAGQTAIAVGLAATNLTSDSPLTTVYQATTGFSAAQGTNNWRYQFASFGKADYQDFNYYDASNGWWQTNARNWTYGGFFGGGQVESGYAADPVLTFVVPTSGVAVVSLASGSVSIPSWYVGYSDGVNVSVWLNSTQVWPTNGAPALVVPGTPVTFSPLQLTLRQGDKLYFRTNMNKNSASDDTYWDPIISLAAQPVPPAAVTTVYQASTNFSSVQGANNWRYQFATVGQNDYTDFNNYSNYGWWQNSPRNWTYGGFFAGGRVDTGSVSDGVLTFVAPSAGSATISLAGGTASIPAGYAGYTDGALLSLRLNDRQLWPNSGSGALVVPGKPVSFSPITVTLKAGDRLYFRTNKNVNSASDDVSWDPIIAFSH